MRRNLLVPAAHHSTIFFHLCVAFAWSLKIRYLTAGGNHYFSRGRKGEFEARFIETVWLVWRFERLLSLGGLLTGNYCTRNPTRLGGVQIYTWRT